MGSTKEDQKQLGTIHFDNVSAEVLMTKRRNSFDKIFEVVFGVGPTAADIQRSEMILVANDLLETTAETLIRKLASSVRMEDRDS